MEKLRQISKVVLSGLKAIDYPRIRWKSHCIVFSAKNELKKKTIKVIVGFFYLKIEIFFSNNVNRRWDTNVITIFFLALSWRDWLIDRLKDFGFIGLAQVELSMRIFCCYERMLKTLHLKLKFASLECKEILFF